MIRRSTFTAGATLGAVAVLTAGCLSEGGGGGGGGGGNTSNNIELMFGFTGNQGDTFEAAFDDFLAENSDIKIKFSPTADFNSLINTRVQGNQKPDIAMFPQPGVMASIAEGGDLADLADIVDTGDLEENMVPGTLEAGQVDGTQYAVLISANIKSTVYYPKEAFEAEYEAPQTLDELFDLTEQIQSDGTAPWCVGIGAAAATGWPATDWVENLMLINYGSDVYNQWVQHEIPFNDPQVADVLSQMEDLLLAEGRTAGGRQAIASNKFETAGNPMFDDPPGCFMHRQGNFLTQPGFFPEEVLSDLDNEVGVFPMPGKTPEDRPVLGGGDMAAVFSADNEAVKKVMEYMTSVEFQNKLATEGWYLSPRTDVDAANYPDETTRNFAEILSKGTEFVFDGSDLMPGEVGSGTFWRDMTSWISGQQDAKTALDNIESSWPA